MNRLTRRLATSAAVGTIAAASLLTGVGQASASSTTVNGWSTWSNPVRCKDSNGATVTMCLYYSPNAAGAFTMGYSMYDSTISETFWKTDYIGSAGYGQAVRNNAASVENAGYSTLGVWVSPWFTGDSNLIPGGRGGNLTPRLRNNEASWGFIGSLPGSPVLRLD
ncbi:hypothetical protein [Kitasatospora sp. NPDC088783]|uniref:hypothetical protein n=1 Tax=Kitasatospora sp. NPDC088783 TaxID=3364077 RepID=UPI0037FFDD4D